MLWRISHNFSVVALRLLMYMCTIESTAQLGLGTQQGPVSAADAAWRWRTDIPHLSFIWRFVSFL